jgi:RHS repeat-associated protein
MRFSTLTFCTLLATTALTASPALAQFAGPTPVRESIDKNGVDLFLGTYNVDSPGVSMGNADNGLSYKWFWRGSGWTDTVNTSLYKSGSTITASMGTASDQFTISGSSYLPALGNGSSLSFNSSTSVYTYTNADGTVVHFSKAMASQTYSNTEGIATDVTSAAGRKFTYNYTSAIYCAQTKSTDPSICVLEATAYRLATVRNSFGYQLGFSYLTDDLNYLPPSNLATWSTRTGGAITNLAVSGSPAPSMSFTFSSAGGVYTQTATDPIGRQTVYRTNGGSQLLGITLPGSSSEDVTIAYTSGRVTGVTTAAGTTSYSSSDASGVRTVTVTDPLSHVTTYTFDISLQRMTGVTDANSHTTSYTYDSSGRLTRATQPEGNYTNLTYDSRGNVTEQRSVAKSGSGLSDIVLTAGYDTTCSNVKTCNQPNWTKDALGNQTDYTYDSTHGGVLTVTSPAPTTGATRPQTRYAYTSLQAYFSNGSSIVASGEPVYELTSTSQCQTGSSCSGTSDEVKTTISYGPQTTGTGNNLLPVSTSSGDGAGTLTATTAMTYDAVGNLTYVDGPLSGTADTTRILYDADREKVGTIGPDPDGAGSLPNRAVKITYGSTGLVTKKEIGTTAGQTDTAWAAFSASQAVDLTYDSARRPATSKLSSGGTAYALTQVSYDAASRLQCTATRMNTAIYGSLPSDACTLGTSGSYGSDRITKTNYDSANQLTSVQVAYGTSDAATERTLTWSNNGKVATLLDAESNLTTFEYDGFDRTVKQRYPSTTKGSGTSSTTDYEQLTYDANSNVTSRRLRDGNSIGLTYDNLNRVTAKDLPGSEPDVTYAYDLLNRPTSASQTGNALSFTWDALGRRLTEVGPQGTATSEYDLAGRRTKLTYPGSGLYVNTDYLVTGEATKVRENGATSGVGVLATYAYDNLGNRTGVTYGNGAAQAFTYDAVSRLASLTNDLSGTTNDLSVTFAYSPASQITQIVRTGDAYAYTAMGNGSTAFTQNGLNQQITIGGSSASWDSKGNLTSEPQSGKTYGYSSENLLTSASGSVTLGYDPALRLYQVAGGTTTRFAYDGANVIADYDGSNALQHRYVFAGMDQPIVQYDSSGNRAFLGSDERGSVISLTDSSGALIGLNSYDEYGKPASGNSGRFQYTGQMWLSEIGAYNYKARVYLPHLGIFAQTDPIRYNGDGPNLYVYTLNDPVNFTDPRGLSELGKWMWDCYGNCSSGYANSPLYTSSGTSGNNSDAANPSGAASSGNGVLTHAAMTEWSDEACHLCNATGQWLNDQYVIIGQRNYSVSITDIVIALGAVGIVAILGGPEDPLGDVLAAEFVEYAEGGTTLFRAVEAGELADIETTGTYRMTEGIGNGKYFYPSQAQAANFATLNAGRSYTLTSADFSTSILSQSWTGTIAGEGSAFVIPGEFFPYGPVTIGGPLP